MIINSCEKESRDTILRIRSEFERDDGKVLKNVATCWVVLHSRFEEVCHNLPDATDSVFGLDVNTAAVEPG